MARTRYLSTQPLFVCLCTPTQAEQVRLGCARKLATEKSKVRASQNRIAARQTRPTFSPFVLDPSLFFLVLPSSHSPRPSATMPCSCSRQMRMGPFLTQHRRQSGPRLVYLRSRRRVSFHVPALVVPSRVWSRSSGSSSTLPPRSPGRSAATTQAFYNRKALLTEVLGQDSICRFNLPQSRYLHTLLFYG